MTDNIKQHILTKENLHQLVSMVNEEMDAAAGEYRSHLEAINTELDDVNRRLERLYDALENSRLELSDLTPRIQTLRQRQDQLRAAKEDAEDKLADRRGELADLKIVEDYAGELRGLLSNSSLAEQKAFIRSFIKENQGYW